MACDICGKSESMLQQLNSEYETDKIKDICGACSLMVNEHLWQLRKMSNKMNQSFLKQFMENWKHKFSGNS